MLENYSPILTTEELAEILKLNSRTIIKLVKEGKIPAMKVANQYRYSKEKIIHWINLHMNDFAEPFTIEDYYHADMFEISAFLSPSLMLFKSQCRDKFALIRELISLADNLHLVADKEQLLKLVTIREKQCSTAIGEDFALPHPRAVTTGIVNKILIIPGIFKDGFLFEKQPRKSINLVFLFAVPSLSLHLKLLSGLTRLLSHRKFKEELKLLTDSRAVIGHFRKYEEILLKSPAGGPVTG